MAFDVAHQLTNSRTPSPADSIELVDIKLFCIELVRIELVRIELVRIELVALACPEG